MEPATMPEWISATPHVVSGMADPGHEIELVTDLLLNLNTRFWELFTNR